jgi:hypothetical protein
MTMKTKETTEEATRVKINDGAYRSGLVETPGIHPYTETLLTCPFCNYKSAEKKDAHGRRKEINGPSVPHACDDPKCDREFTHMWQQCFTCRKRWIVRPANVPVVGIKMKETCLVDQARRKKEIAPRGHVSRFLTFLRDIDLLHLFFAGVVIYWLIRMFQGLFE